MPMKRISSMPEARLLVAGAPGRSFGIGGLGPLHEHKAYGTGSPEATRKVSDNDETDPAVEDDYGFFSMGEDNYIASEPGERAKRRGSSSSFSSENSSEFQTSSCGSASGRQRRPRRKSALKKGSSYGVDDIPLDFERREFNRVLPKPDLSHRACMSSAESPGFIRSSSRGMFRVSSEPVFVRPVYLEEDNEQDLSSTNDFDASEHSESSFVEGAMKRRISFGTIQVREHKQTIGDNPSCTYGTPIQLDWDHQDMEELKLEDYETYRPTRRTKQKFHLNSFQRANLLKLNGHSTNEINESERKTSKARNQRERTKFVVQNYPQLVSVEDAIESGFRKVKRSISKSKLSSMDVNKNDDLARRSSKDDLSIPAQSKALVLEMMDNDVSNSTAPF
mmetsp:Transcript_10123/g.24273  ORF Transcript_10123/g.24273 Transcript_10123/m.24273 type:complete len:392 (-) Transcript_10123:248-1423(-)